LADVLDIYAYDDYRAFTTAWLDSRDRLTQSWLARKVKSVPSFVSMVLRAQRNLSLPDGRVWGMALGLKDDELTYYEAMVRAEHAPTLALRRAARTHMRAARDFAHAVHAEDADHA
jgi:hypothetical protein